LIAARRAGPEGRAVGVDMTEAMRVQIADIVIGEALSESALRDIDLWTG
jgi:hypothetical protein